MTINRYWLLIIVCSTLIFLLLSGAFFAGIFAYNYRFHCPDHFDTVIYTMERRCISTSDGSLVIPPAEAPYWKRQNQPATKPCTAF